MGVFPRRPVRRLRDGTFELNLGEVERRVIADGLGYLREQLVDGEASTDRLFPPAYSEPGADEDEYQRLMRDDLVRARLEAIEAVERTLEAEVVDEAALTGWMQSLNALRLVLGTRLGVTEDHELGEGLVSDDEEPLLDLYDYLSVLLGFVVDALAESLEGS